MTNFPPKKMTVSELSSEVTQDVLEAVMHSDFVGTVKDFVPAYKSTNNKTGRVVYKFDFSNYFTMVSTNKGEQNTVVNITGSVRKVKDVFIKSGFTINKNDQTSLNYINEFLKQVSDILPNDIKAYNNEIGDLQERQYAGNFEFEVKVKTVLFIKSRYTVSERLNCSLSIISRKTGIVERVKFRIQDSKFIFGNSVFELDVVKPDFFKHKLKKVFLTYSKNIVDEYGLMDTTKRPKDVNDEEYEKMKTIVKMITI